MYLHTGTNKSQQEQQKVICDCWILHLLYLDNNMSSVHHRLFSFNTPYWAVERVSRKPGLSIIEEKMIELIVRIWSLQYKKCTNNYMRKRILMLEFLLVICYCHLGVRKGIQPEKEPLATIPNFAFWDWGWLHSVLVRASDLWSTGCKFDSQPRAAGLVLGWVNHLGM